MPDTFDRLKAALADRYAIERELGSGGMATVYLAEDLIMEGTIGDLVLPAWAFENPQDATLLSVPLTVPILRVGERLLVGLKPTAHSREVRRPGPVPSSHWLDALQYQGRYLE